MSKKLFLTVMLILLSSLQPSYSGVPQAESNVNISLFGANLTVGYNDCNGKAVTEEVLRGYTTYICVQALSEISFKNTSNNQPVPLTPGGFMPPSGRIFINCYGDEKRPLKCAYGVKT